MMMMSEKFDGALVIHTMMSFLYHVVVTCSAMMATFSDDGVIRTMMMLLLTAQSCCYLFNDYVCVCSMMMLAFVLE